MYTGRSVSGAGDFNNDGIDDVIFTGRNSDTQDESIIYESHILFGMDTDTPVPSARTGPDNDLFSNAASIDGVSQSLLADSTYTIDGTTVRANPQNGEPYHASDFFVGRLGAINPVWYRWTPEVTDIVEFDTAGSEIKTVLAVYTGNRLINLELVASAIDNDTGTAVVRFVARAGETYHFAVDGYVRKTQGAIALNARRPRMDLSECTITGTDGPDTLRGTSAPDVICALGGDDRINGFGSDDIIFAGSGNDIVFAGSGNDMMFGENGTDRLFGESGNDVADRGKLRDKLFGGNGEDVLFGRQGPDLLSGQEDEDILFGGKGADRLIGGPGSDYVDGGPFNDVCVSTKFDSGFDTTENCTIVSPAD